MLAVQYKLYISHRNRTTYGWSIYIMGPYMHGMKSWLYLYFMGFRDKAWEIQWMHSFSVCIYIVFYTIDIRIILNVTNHILSVTFLLIYIYIYIYWEGVTINFKLWVWVGVVDMGLPWFTVGWYMAKWPDHLFVLFGFQIKLWGSSVYHQWTPFSDGLPPPNPKNRRRKTICQRKTMFEIKGIKKIKNLVPIWHAFSVC